MAQVATKFGFDRVFGVDPVNTDAAMADQHTTDLAAARQIAYAEGYAAAESRIQSDLLAQNADTAKNIDAKLTALFSDLATVQQSLVAEAAQCIGALAEKIAGEALLQFPLDRIEGIVAPMLAELIDTPRLVIRVCPALLDAARLQLEDLAIASSYSGKLVFIAEDSLLPGDVLMEWAHGGLDARMALATAQLRTALADFRHTTHNTTGNPA
jgi:flagellar biosynthesis/type III secretory pathway protein FliH